ncbi:GerA spore germination protein [Salsuginibacillus halophilus]|uniref:GerA spore germination protein n=1 Tax=Salsuginibacillus halophilus TaxID=517424 RepID=A0A2P8HW49_9BACI|nr:spore germination protein [Salsuginibacillus halophilus]PSL50449.1 GerA spore germination protein [Salsuginibacillus halophilus]
MRRWFYRNKGEKKTDKTLAEHLEKLKKASGDFEQYVVETNHGSFVLSYYDPLIDKKTLSEQVIAPLKLAGNTNWNEAAEVIWTAESQYMQDKDRILDHLARGYIFIRRHNGENSGWLCPAKVEHEREINVPEVEFSVAGPQESFVEGLDTNLFLIRKRLPVAELQVEKMRVGTTTQTDVAIIYLKGVVNEENLQTVRQRLQDVTYDHIQDTNQLAQMIQDKTLTLFPQFVNTERPDRVAAILVEGKIAFISEGSPEAVTAPATLLEFFSSLEDYYLPWYVATFIRFLRFGAVAFSILATPIYVAVLTYHYEMIPKDLLATLVASRSNIPFPPVIEALFLEFTIELLREAGARLPSKVGQTIGIVGGIVIGQASVEAGLTSNILLIVVALAALASFTTPVYQMGNTIRILRFPFILATAFMGLIGLAVTLMFTVIHLMKLTSLGRPYLEPFFPLRLTDWKDAVLRLPFSFFKDRPQYTRPKRRFRGPQKHKRQGQKSPDIDEFYQ